MYEVRHYCNLDDKLEKWGWNEHNGKDYGKQVIVDQECNLQLTIVFSIDPGIQITRARLFNNTFRWLGCTSECVTNQSIWPDTRNVILRWRRIGQSIDVCCIRIAWIY